MERCVENQCLDTMDRLELINKGSEDEMALRSAMYFNMEVKGHRGELILES